MKYERGHLKKTLNNGMCTPLVGVVPKWVISTDPKEWPMYPSNWDRAQTGHLKKP
jgi:hypothetical protein